MVQANQIRTYSPGASVVFLKTKERFGGLSNMAGGFPLCMNGIPIRTSEALYQACRFPHLPDVQRLIIEQRSPMTAKMRGKPHPSRPDWDAVRVKIMRWCLRVKLAQNWKAFGDLLLKTGDQPIVEQSRRDDFWGAKVMDDGSLVGMNVLGRLLMELREQLKADTGERLKIVEPLLIPDFLLFQQPIRKVYDGEYHDTPETAAPTIADPSQLSVLDQPVTHKNWVDIQYTTPSKQENKKGLQPYPAYKPSGVEWLGEVPEHWEVKKLCSILRNVTERNCPDLPLLSVVREKGVILRDVSSKEENHNFIPDDLTNYKVVRTGQFAMNKMKAWQGSYGVSQHDGIVSPAYFIFNLYGVQGDFFHAAIRSRAYIPFFTQASDGVRIGQWDLSQERMREITFSVPPLPEQTAIVRYLDYFDRRIRRYIGAKKKLIKLLEEQKRSVIHCAVTRGLDPDVPLKPSGVEWLGEVPEHWEVKKLRSILRNVTERNCPDLPLLSVVREKGVILRDVSSKEENHNFIPDDLTNYKVVRTGQFAMNKMKAWQGSYGVSQHDGIVSPAYFIFNLYGVQGDFFHAAIRSRAYIPFFTHASDGVRTGQWDLSQARMREITFSVPPLPEQTAIVKHLDKTTADLDTTITRARRGIDLLQEYRTRLTADVVIGKLDVREAAAALPDESVPLSG